MQARKFLRVQCYGSIPYVVSLLTEKPKEICASYTNLYHKITRLREQSFLCVCCLIPICCICICMPICGFYFLNQYFIIIVRYLFLNSVDKSKELDSMLDQISDSLLKRPTSYHRGHIRDQICIQRRKCHQLPIKIFFTHCMQKRTTGGSVGQYVLSIRRGNFINRWILTSDMTLCDQYSMLYIFIQS